MDKQNALVKLQIKLSSINNQYWYSLTWYEKKFKGDLQAIATNMLQRAKKKYPKAMAYKFYNNQTNEQLKI